MTCSRNWSFQLIRRSIMKRAIQPKLFWRALARENIDVLVAGALEKEIVLHPFLGNVARRLVREAQLLGDAVHASREEPETAAPHRVHCGSFTAEDWWR